MTMPETTALRDRDTVRELLEKATPAQIRRLLADIRLSALSGTLE